MGEKTPLHHVLTRRTRQSRRRQLRQMTFVLGTLLLVYCLAFVWISPSPAGKKGGEEPRRKKTLPAEVLDNLSLNEQQCRAYFPGLTKEVDDMVARGPFEVKQTGDLGPLQGRIKDGRVRRPFCYVVKLMAVD